LRDGVSPVKRLPPAAAACHARFQPLDRPGLSLSKARCACTMD
jgi:hypothetical protein